MGREAYTGGERNRSSEHSPSSKFATVHHRERDRGIRQLMMRSVRLSAFNIFALQGQGTDSVPTDLEKSGRLGILCYNYVQFNYEFCYSYVRIWHFGILSRFTLKCSEKASA